MRTARKLMVTGARGFVAGSVIAQALQNWRVHALSRGEPLLEHPNLKWHVLNPLDQAALSQLFHEIEPDAVIHTAAVANIDFCEANRDFARKVNVEMTSVLVDLCTSSGSKLLFCSTDNVFDGEHGPYREDDMPAPVNFYGRTKLDAEEIVARAGSAAVIARLAFVVGFPVLGPGNSFLSRVVEAVRSGHELCAPENEFRSPIDVITAGRALLELADRRHSGMFHLAGNDRLNRLELLHELIGVLGLPPAKISTVDPVKLHARAPRPRDVSLDNSKARSFLATPMLGFRDGLALVIKQSSAHRAQLGV